MASVVTPLDQPSNYKDSQARVDRQKQHDIFQKSTTLYVRLCFINHSDCTNASLSYLQIGNLSFYTTEEQIHDMFSKCSNPEDGGGVKRIIMGLDRHTRYVTLFDWCCFSLTCASSSGRTPCGFCFVEFYTHAEALASMRYISGTKLDERIIRCDLDLGYKDGRQFGRGKSGGQVRPSTHKPLVHDRQCDILGSRRASTRL